MTVDYSEFEPILIGNRQQYLKLLELLRKDTKKVVIVQIDGEEDNDPVIDNAMLLMSLENKRSVSKWRGTTAYRRNAAEYTFTGKRGFFEYLQTYESFFFSWVDGNGVFCMDDTDFGMDDIAFLDGDGKTLFFTTTHEGYAYLHKKYVSDYDQ